MFTVARSLKGARLGRAHCAALSIAALTVAIAVMAGPAVAASPSGAQLEDTNTGPTSTAAATAVASRRRRPRNDLDRDGIPNRRDRDMDGDRIGNKRDRNVDGDRWRNAPQRDGNIDADRRKNGRDREMDGDRLRNSRDRDIDADRLKNCPRDRDMDADRKPNSRDRDMDADGVPNALDKDIDSDGAPNKRDSDMDCDRVPNRFDPDIDGDGLLNYLDPDSDADGISADGTIPPGVRLPKTFFGLVAVHPFGVEGLARAIQLRQVAATGVGTLRHVFEWADIERLPGIYNFSTYDAAVRDASQHGFTLQPILFNPPAFRSSRPATGANRGTYPPRSNAEFGAFAAALVRRYGRNGSFWAQNRGIPVRPITTWQIWNEPHISVYWPTGPNPAAYTAMLKTVSLAIKGVDSGAEVLPAAISQSNLGISMLSYIQGMYDAGARGYFDTLAVNPYAQAADQVLELMLEVRHMMNRNGDGGRPVRVTELGWATSGPQSPFRTTYEGQAELIKRTWATLVRNRGALGLRGLVYFSWRDLLPYMSPFQDYFGLHTGLLELDGRPKLGLGAFAYTVRAMSAQ